MLENINMRDVRCPKCQKSLFDDFYLINPDGLYASLDDGGYPTIRLSAKCGELSTFDIRTSAIYGVRATHGLAQVPMGSRLQIACPICNADLSKNPLYDSAKERGEANMEGVGLCTCGASLFELSGVYYEPGLGIKSVAIRACTRWGCHEHLLIARESAERTPMTPCGKEGVPDDFAVVCM